NGPKTGKPTGHEIFEAIASAAGKKNDVATNRIRELGFDGMTHTQGSIATGIGPSHSERERVWIAFEPNQIKAAANQGTFDPNTDKIALSATFDESKHKRGQPKNAGQFGSGGNKAAAPTPTAPTATHAPVEQAQPKEQSATPAKREPASAKDVNITVTGDIGKALPGLTKEHVAALAGARPGS